MRPGSLAATALACAVAWQPDVYAAEELDSPLVALSLGEAVREGKLLFMVRPRFTWVEQDGQPDDTQWGSLRTQLGWETLEYRGFQLTAEVIDTIGHAPLVGVLPDDPVGARALCGDAKSPKVLGRTRLVRAAGDLAARLAPAAPTAVLPPQTLTPPPAPPIAVPPPVPAPPPAWYEQAQVTS